MNVEESKALGKGILVGLAIVVGLLAFTWVIQGNEFFLYKFFAPR